MAYSDKSAIWLTAKEASYGAGAVFNPLTDMVEFINPSIDANIESINREVIKNSLVSAAPILGKETSSGTLTVEATALNAGELNGDVLYEAAMGIKIPAVPIDATATATDATTLAVADGTLYQVGQAVTVGFSGATVDEVVIIRAISTNTLTVSTITGAFGSVNEVTGELSYRLAAPSDATVSLAVQEFLQGTNNITYTYDGVVVDSMTVNLPVANIITTDFSVGGAGFAVADGVAAITPNCFELDPFIGKNFVFKYGGVSYDAGDVTINLTNDVYDTEAITTAGITNKTITAKSTVGGSFTLDYDGIALFNAYKAGTGGELIAESPTQNGGRMGVYAPNVILSGVKKSIDSATYKDNIDFACLSSTGCSGVEDALTIWFA